MSKSTTTARGRHRRLAFFVTWIGSVVMVSTLATPATAQLTVSDLPWSDDFESYVDGSILAGQGVWEVWDESPSGSHFIVTSAEAYESSQSMRITNVDDALVQFDLGAADGTGVYEVSVWSWVPPDFSDNAWFILLNTYNHGLAGAKDWSVDLELSGATGVARDFETDNEADLVYGAWAHIEVAIDLVNDWCDITYDGVPLGGREWSQGGATRLEAIDFWGDETDHAIYFDDAIVRMTEATGACCFPDAMCLEDQVSIDCVAAGGLFQGFEVTCLETACPLDGPNGWQVTAPFTWSGDTCETSNACGLREGNDEQWEVTIPSAGPWTFSVCGAEWDSWLALADDTGCSDALAVNDDACGAASEITVELTPGVYFLTLEGFSPLDCGDFVLTVTAGCLLSPSPGAIDEGEGDCFDGYVDTFNSGCNLCDQGEPGCVPPSTSIACGETFFGSTGNYEAGDATTRDTDWYEIVLAQPTVITYQGISDGDFQLLTIAPGPGEPGDPSYCDDLSILDFAQPAACAHGEITTEVDAGTYWLWAGVQSGVVGLPCPTAYEISVSCVDAPCAPDLDDSGAVDTTDLVLVLSTWGVCAGCPADLDGDGRVGFADLLFVLSRWGPCP